MRSFQKRSKGARRLAASCSRRLSSFRQQSNIRILAFFPKKVERKPPRRITDSVRQSVSKNLPFGFVAPASGNAHGSKSSDLSLRRPTCSRAAGWRRRHSGRSGGMWASRPTHSLSVPARGRTMLTPAAMQQRDFDVVADVGIGHYGDVKIYALLRSTANSDLSCCGAGGGSGVRRASGTAARCSYRPMNTRRTAPAWHPSAASYTGRCRAFDEIDRFFRRRAYPFRSAHHKAARKGHRWSGESSFPLKPLRDRNGNGICRKSGQNR